MPLSNVSSRGATGGLARRLVYQESSGVGVRSLRPCPASKVSMDVILRDYSVNDATWFYLSLLLILAVFFRFSRVFALRNLDLVLLLSISPGLLLVQNAESLSLGYGWLFVVTGLLLMRLFVDSFWKRRPLLEPNLNYAGMAFLAAAAFTFLMSEVITEPPPRATVETVRRADEFLKRQDTTAEKPGTVEPPATEEAQPGPAAILFAAPAVPASRLVLSGTSDEPANKWAVEQIAARVIAVLAHLAVVAGLWLLGKRLFSDAQTGLAMATLYLLLPCTAYDVGEVKHVLPAALIVWAFVGYRNPLVAGSLMGLACGTLLFPVFLLPLWAVFYGRQGAGRFALALGVVGSVLLLSLLFTAADSDSFKTQILGSIDWSSLKLDSRETFGFWSTHDRVVYRIPVIVAFFVMLLTLTFLPRQKNLEHLLGHSTAIVVATQLWYPQQGGTYVLWYLPLVLAVMFRPRLTNQTSPVVAPAPPEDVQLSDPSRLVLGSSWLGRRMR
jgi:hypothetical protein